MDEPDGYAPAFLGEEYVFPPPTFSCDATADVVTPDGQDDPLLRYPNYSVVMNRRTRQAFFAIANADFNSPGRGRRYRLDGRIDSSLQLSNVYYRDIDGVVNPYDRGHLAQRDAVAWGATQLDADRASRDSCFYTNIALQHRNFNDDEWFSLERAIAANKLEQDGRCNTVTGPAFCPIGRSVRPLPELPPAPAPAAFWKVTAYVDKDSKLAVNAFLAMQDDEAIAGMRDVLGDASIDPFAIYQTSTTLIGVMTGLEFPSVAYDANPMLYHATDATRSAGVATPQLQEVGGAKGPHRGVVFRQ